MKRKPCVPNNDEWKLFFQDTTKAELMEISMYLSMRLNEDDMVESLQTLKKERQIVRRMR